MQWCRLETLSNSDRTWRLVQCYLPDFISLSSQVRFRFVAADESPGSVVEAALDDFSLLGFPSSATGVAQLPVSPQAELFLAQNQPNPFNPVTTIRFRVPPPGQKVTLRVFDPAGRRVVTLLENQMVSGEQKIPWHGRDEADRAVASGVYFYQLRTDRQALTRKLMLIR
jgi:hypothetical protein